MPQPDDAPRFENLALSDSDPDALFDSPAKPKRKAKQPNGSTTESEGSAPRPESRYSAEEAREAALRKELDSVRNINKVIEDVVGSLEKAKNNMEVSGCKLPHIRQLKSDIVYSAARPSHAPSHPHRPSSKPGHGSCHRQNTTSA